MGDARHQVPDIVDITVSARPVDQTVLSNGLDHLGRGGTSGIPGKPPTLENHAVEMRRV